MQTSSRLSVLERILLVIPLVSGLLFGLFPLLSPGAFASVTAGIPATDPFIYRLAGAATFGYAVALAFGLRQGTWTAVRLIVIAVLTFNLASLYACGVEIVSPSTVGGTKPVIYLILAASLALIAITATLLYRHRNDAKLGPDTASWVVTFLVIATILAAIFALTPLFYPQLTRLFGFKVKDLFLYRQAGAATLGYAVMGVFELRSRNWSEMRWPIVMAAVFNGLSFLASLLTITLGESYLLPALVAIASLGVTIAAIVALRTNGSSSSERLAAPLASH
ncbi:MAG TPA: hypothetical protein VJ761_11560 [Ktedonobacteraceae bacterium]|nr:hypothetical protein [Ktedonobacteraceae bacterium]